MSAFFGGGGGYKQHECSALFPWPAPSSGSACSFSLDQASGADLLLLLPPAGRIYGSFFLRGSGGPRGTSPAGNWECDPQLHHPESEKVIFNM